MNRKHHLTFLGCVILCIGFLSCAVPDKQPAPEPQTPRRDSLHLQEGLSKFATGQEVFQQKCVACHSLGKQNDSLNKMPVLYEALPAPPEWYFMEFVGDSRSLRISGDQFVDSLRKKSRSEFEHVYRDSLSIRQLEGLEEYVRIRADSTQSS